MSITLKFFHVNKTLITAIPEHVFFYLSTINLNYIWSFGSLVGLFFYLQLITGLFLSMHYTAHVDLAFDSVVHIMNDIKNGWLINYMHANGTSMIFIFINVTAFIGYMLPWYQMTFWWARVITSLVTAVPFIGENIAYWIWCGFYTITFFLVIINVGFYYEWHRVALGWLKKSESFIN